MTEHKKLYELLPGESAIVRTLSDNGRNITARLSDIGLTSGQTVTCTMKSPLGDPSAYLIRGAVIALRRCDADTVEIVAQPAANRTENAVKISTAAGEVQ